MGNFTALMELARPTVDDDVTRLVRAHGFEAVKEALDKQAPRKKRGPPKEPVWPELHRLFIAEDARTWLEGGDPFVERTNYAIAKGYADLHPGHSHPATMKKIERRLKEQPYGRPWQTLVSAMEQSRDAYPYASHIRTLEALAELDCHPVWEMVMESKKRDLDNYTAEHGEPPDSLTMKEIEAGARTPLENFLGTPLLPPPPGGMFGLLTPPPKNALRSLGARFANDAGGEA